MALFANNTTCWPGRAPVTRPVTDARDAGPPVSALGIAVNSIVGSAVDWCDPQPIESRKTIDRIGFPNAVGTSLMLMTRHRVRDGYRNGITTLIVVLYDTYRPLRASS